MSENKSVSLVLEQHLKKNDIANDKTSCSTKCVKSVVDKSISNLIELPDNKAFIDSTLLKINENFRTEGDLSFNGSTSILGDEHESPRFRPKNNLLILSDNEVCCFRPKSNSKEIFFCGSDKKSEPKSECKADTIAEINYVEIKSAKKKTIHAKNMNFITPKKIGKSPHKLMQKAVLNDYTQEQKENISKNSNQKSCKKTDQKSCKKTDQKSSKKPNYVKYLKKGYDINEEFDYKRALNVLKPIDTNLNTSKEKIFGKCHGYATYDHSSGDFNDSLRGSYFNEVEHIKSLEGLSLDKSNSKAHHKNKLKNIITGQLSNAKKKEGQESPNNVKKNLT